MIYREHPPHPGLAPYVACYWTLRGHVVAGEERDRAVVPDACMDILFNLAAPEPGSAASRVIGTMTRPLAFRDAGILDLLGVRFRAGGATPFLRFPASEVTDGTLSLSDLWGADAEDLADRLQAAADTPSRLGILEEALQTRLDAGRVAADPTILDAAALAERSGGTVEVDALARATGLGRRQLERRFLAIVGIPPKTACRVLRFQAALTKLRTAGRLSLSRVAMECGYHDQAHFTRDFRAFAGVTPGVYRRTQDDAFLQDREGDAP
jgi:AraC-like DNA-binding protein